MTEADVDRVAKAIENIPDIWGRRNKARMDGLQWEVGYFEPGEAISENTTHIIAVFAEPLEAAKRAEAERKLFRARAAIAAMPSWQPIETAIESAKSNDGWIPRCLFGKLQPWGWATWVGQCDDEDVWLGVQEDGSCWECEIPTHWAPLLEPHELHESATPMPAPE